MLNYSKFIAFTLTSFSFYTASVSILLKPAFAGEPIIDRNCNRHERTPEVFRKILPQNQAVILQSSHFKVNNQKYTLQLLKFPNSTNVLCLWKPNKRLPERLKNVSIIQDKVIEKVGRENLQTANFIITVKGKKTEDILNTAYKLDLTNPNQPKLTPLIRVYKK
ncbi:hypothetical protein H6G76_03260 [Nostoc sp. FACHB-152]|uniref:hypothetical protein n=1 Tax=unclassified Nostoc TaxID=2593658 RepID=UPI001686047A|nr:MULTISPECIES: hypothetical protein [unclassified Nostoc]MBD2446189.1 hypothetical protein [Nostoc sp. FACHB-152]MBD2467421.1 hypothetical protein [Nostoc sp. FACHB-145]